MSAHVGTIISESGMAENVRVPAGSISSALLVQKLFSLSVFMAAILSSGCRPTSARVDSPMSESGVGANVGVVVEISVAVVTQADITCIYADFKALPLFGRHI